MFTSTTSKEEFVEQVARLTELAQSGRLRSHQGQLQEAMMAVYEDEIYGRSVGWEWLSKNPELCAGYAAEFGFSVRAFLTEHSGRQCVGAHILLCPEVLKLIGEDERAEFVRDIYRVQNWVDNAWIESVLQVGVPPSTVAELIREKVEAVPDDGELQEGFNAVCDFLNDGEMGLRKDSPTPWSVMTDDEFRAVAQMCARKATALFFMRRVAIEKRLGESGEAVFAELVREPLLNLDFLTQEEQSFVEQQPIAFQLEVAARLRSGVEFILGLILKLDQEEGEKLYREKSEVFYHEGVENFCCTTLAAWCADGKPIQPWFECELKRLLTPVGSLV